MNHFKSITRNNADPLHKQSVLLIAETYDQAFFDFAAQILRIADCHILYSEEPLMPGVPLLEEFSEPPLLVVFYLTQRFLAEERGKIETVVKELREKNVPVVPVFSEEIDIRLYTGAFGDIQYLSLCETDPTALPPKEKLEKCIIRVLIPDEMEKKIKDAFAAFVFVSYRKKDRAEAQKLMRLIHQNRQCRDIAFWYDEFLISGESFPEAIQKAITDSDLFLLTVTPNTLEGDNYILTQELPFANREKKRILAAECLSTDSLHFYAAFGEKYGLRLHCPEEISDFFLRIIMPDDYKTDESPMHLFFIGLAYYNGIYVEKNTEKGIDLIRRAAESGLPEAIERMVHIFMTGSGTPIDYPAAFAWQEKLVRILEEQYLHAPDRSYKNGYYKKLTNALSLAGQLAAMCGDTESAERCYARAMDVLNKIDAYSKDAPLYGLWELSFMYDIANLYVRLATVEEDKDEAKALALYKTALAYFEKSSWNNSDFRIARCKLSIAGLLERAKMFESARDYALEALAILERMESKTYTESFWFAFSLFLLAKTEKALSGNASIADVIQQCETAVSILAQIYRETEEPYYLDMWFDVVQFSATTYLESDKEEKAYDSFLQLIEIADLMEKHYDYARDRDTEKEERLREAQSIAYYYCAIVAGIRNREDIAYSFLVEAESALFRLSAMRPGKYEDRMNEVEELLYRLEGNGT